MTRLTHSKCNRSCALAKKRIHVSCLFAACLPCACPDGQASREDSAQPGTVLKEQSILMNSGVIYAVTLAWFFHIMPAMICR